MNPSSELTPWHCHYTISTHLRNSQQASLLNRCFATIPMHTAHQCRDLPHLFAQSYTLAQTSARQVSHHSDHSLQLCLNQVLHEATTYTSPAWLHQVSKTLWWWQGTDSNERKDERACGVKPDSCIRPNSTLDDSPSKPLPPPRNPALHADQRRGALQSAVHLHRDTADNGLVSLFVVSKFLFE